MAEGIVCIIFILGLLNFAKEAPQLLKDLLGKSGLFAGMDLNPKGQLKRGAKVGLDAAKAIGHTAKKFSPTNVRSKVGGLKGGLAGAKAGFKAKQGKGVRGLVSGVSGIKSGAIAGRQAGAAFGEAGVYKQSKGAIGDIAKHAAQYNDHVKKFDDTRNQLKDATDKLYAGSQDKIDKKKKEMEALEADYKTNVRQKAYDLMNNSSAADKIAMKKAQQEAEYAKKAKELGISIDDAKSNDAIRSEVLNKVDNMSMNDICKAAAERMYKAKYEQDKHQKEFEIAELKGKDMAQYSAVANLAIANWKNQQGDWGDAISKDFMKEFNDALKGMKNEQLINNINQLSNDLMGKSYAGDGELRCEFNNLDEINKFMDKLQTSNDPNAKIALSQIMDQINKASGKTNTGSSVQQNVINVYNPEPADNGKKEDKK